MHLDYKNLGVGTAIIDSLESLLSDLKSQAGNVRSFPPEYPGNLMSSINEVADAVDSINGAELQALQQKVTTVTQQIQSPSFGFTNPEYSDFLEGYNSFNNVLNNIKNNDGEILDSYDTQIFNEYTQENNTANALEFYSKKNIQGTLTEEEAKAYKNLQDEHRYATKNAYNDNINREVAAYEIKESEKSWWDKTTESIYGAWNDITDAISETGSTWVTAFKSGNFNDYLQALKETGSTLFVAGSSVLAGVQKIEEFVVDGIVFLRGTVVSGIVLLGDKIFGTDNASYIMDGTLDFIRRDLVGEARKNFYEDTGLGKWINDNSNLKYDSQGANGIQSLTEVAAKIAIATAATIATGGAAAPIAIGLLYGFGNATEKYTQSVDRENGESYDYKKAILKAIAGGATGAAEFYGYGQMGAAVLGKGITEAASTSFVKNFINTDTAVDTLSVVIDHGVNAALGDESWQDALFYGGAEVLLGLGMSAIGARKATKAARSAELADDISAALPKVDVDDIEYNSYNKPNKWFGKKTKKVNRTVSRGGYNEINDIYAVDKMAAFYEKLGGSYGQDQGAIKNLCDYWYGGRKYNYNQAKEIVNDAISKGYPIPKIQKVANQEYFGLKNKLMTKYGFSSETASIIMSSVDDAGACSYASTCNEIFYKFKDNPRQFEKIFGYPMYKTTHGVTSLNDTELLLDLYVHANDIKNGERLLWNDSLTPMCLSDKIDVFGRTMPDVGSNQVYMSNPNFGKNVSTIDSFLKSKDKNLEFQSEVFFNNMHKWSYSDSDYNDIMNSLKDKIAKGETATIDYYYNAQDNDRIIRMLSYDKSKYPDTSTALWNEGAGHSTTITGIYDGGITISSWGNKYFIPKDDLQKGGRFMIMTSNINGIN